MSNNDKAKYGTKAKNENSSDSDTFWLGAIVTGIGLAVGTAVGYIIGAESNTETQLVCNTPNVNTSNTCQMTLAQGSKCAVCLDEIQPLKVLNCGHTFHEVCIQKWLEVKKECPFCRAQQ